MKNTFDRIPPLQYYYDDYPSTDNILDQAYINEINAREAASMSVTRQRGWLIYAVSFEVAGNDALLDSLMPYLRQEDFCEKVKTIQDKVKVPELELRKETVTSEDQFYQFPQFIADKISDRHLTKVLDAEFPEFIQKFKTALNNIHNNMSQLTLERTWAQENPKEFYQMVVAPLGQDYISMDKVWAALIKDIQDVVEAVLLEQNNQLQFRPK